VSERVSQETLCAVCGRRTLAVRFASGRRLVIDALPSERGQLILAPGRVVVHEASAPLALRLAAGPDRFVAHSAVCGLEAA
jgi:hypothetical protein